MALVVILLKTITFLIALGICIHVSLGAPIPSSSATSSLSPAILALSSASVTSLSSTSSALSPTTPLSVKLSAPTTPFNVKLSVPSCPSAIHFACDPDTQDSEVAGAQSQTYDHGGADGDDGDDGESGQGGAGAGDDGLVLVYRRSILGKIKTAFKSAAHTIKSHISQLAKLGFAALSSAQMTLSRVAKYVPVVGGGLSEALKTESSALSLVSSSIHAPMSGKYGVALRVVNGVRDPVGFGMQMAEKGVQKAVGGHR